VLGVFWVPFIRRNGVRYMQATTLRRNPTQTQPCMRARDVRGADVIVDRRPRDDRPFQKGGGDLPDVSRQTRRRSAATNGYDTAKSVPARKDPTRS
jgi:hypothetical protein